MNSTIRHIAGKDVFWITAAFVLKGCFILAFVDVIYDGLSAINFSRSGIGYEAGDTQSYFDPVDSWLLTGSYSPDYRMPGYGMVYGIFRLIFDKEAAMTAIIIAQLIFSAAATFYLAKTGLLLTNSKKIFLFVFAVYGLSMRATFWDFTYLTESFAVSSAILSYYFLVQFLVTRRAAHAVAAGLFLTWLVFLKPVYAPLWLLAAFGVILYLKRKKLTFSLISRICLPVLIPFLILDGVWVIRNYAVHHRFIPLTKQTYTDYFEETYKGRLMDFVIAYGGERSMWVPSSEFAWYLPGDTGTPPPEVAYTSQFNADSLEKVKSDIAAVERSNVTEDSARLLNNSIKERLTRYRNSIRAENPLLYYVAARVKFLRKFLVHTGTDFLRPITFREMTLKQKFLKLLNSAFYGIALLFGMTGCLLVLLKRDWLWLTVALAALYAVLIYPLLGHLEPRYFLPAYPLLLLLAAYSFRNFRSLQRR